MADVRLVGISKRFDDVEAVDDVTLVVDDHDFMVLLGPSGCGKSTLLRIIAGLEEPTSGNVFIGDTMVNDLEPKQRDVAMVFQSYALYPHKTVQANIEFPLKARGVDGAERTRKAAQVAEALGLTPFMARRPGQLSGGQRQRVALARALVREPAVFCMDEPLSNLDAKLRTEMRAELVALHSRLPSTFVYVTHDQVEAMTMGRRVAVMNQGRIEQVGTPADVYAKPASIFVATFIGTPPMNVLPAGRIEGEGDGIRVGVRPEHVELTTEGDGDLDGSVTLVEHLGHEVLVHVAVDGHPIACRVDPASQRLPGRDDRVGLSVPVSHRHRFNAADEQRIEVGSP